MTADWERLEKMASEEVEGIIQSLPMTLRERARAVPVTFTAVPGPEWLEDGIEADSLGLFVGPAFADEEHAAEPLPAHIILFLENLWEFAEKDELVYREELRRTYMHELGHYLGLDEQDLEERDLD